MDWRERSVPMSYGLTNLTAGYWGSGISGWRTPLLAEKQDEKVFGHVAEEGQLSAIQNATFEYPYYSSFGGTERIWSTKNGRGKWNDCRHWRDVGFNYCFGTSYIQNWIGGQVRYLYGTRVFDSLAVPNQPVVNWALVDQNVRAEAYHTMIPRFEGEVAMLNFLFELKDFRDISHLMFKNGRFQAALDSIKDLTVDSYTRKGADLVLANNFALQPLISDVATLTMQAQQIVADAQEAFKMKGSEENIRHCTIDLGSTYSVDSAAVLTEGPIYGKRTTLASNKFTASMSYTYEYRSRSKFEAFLQFYGFKPNFSIIWNAVPFSFLADYFVSIGKSLHVMDKDPNLVLNRHQYCESIKAINARGVCLYSTDSSDWNPQIALIDNRGYVKLRTTPSIERMVTGIARSGYERFVGEPYFGPALPRFRIPSGKQALNMAALLRVLL